VPQAREMPIKLGVQTQSILEMIFTEDSFNGFAPNGFALRS
jgi:hypothetical protein